MLFRLWFPFRAYLEFTSGGQGCVIPHPSSMRHHYSPTQNHFMKRKFSNGMSVPNFLAVFRQLFINYLANLTAFTSFKSMYTETYGSDLIELVDETLDLPNLEQRLLPGKMLRDLNKKRTGQYLALFGQLESYIDTAFPVDTGKYKIEAGAGYVQSAFRYEWPNIKKMITSVDTFLTTQATKLADDGFMPAAFATNITTMGAALTLGIDQYDNVKTMRPDKTDELRDKLKAKSDGGKAISRDGKLIFKGDDIKRRLFIFSEVKKTVLGTKAAGIKIWVRDAEGGLLQPNASIHVSAFGFVTRHYMTDAKGFVHVHPIDAGIYKVAISKPGFLTQTMDWTVKTSVSSRLKVMLVREAENG